MSKPYYLNDSAITAMLLRQLALQLELIEAQQQIITLQQQIVKMTPKRPKDKDVFWHLVSDGLSSTEAANSDDPLTVRQFRDWNVAFAKKYIKPYVNEKVYGECLNQMTRGLNDRLAELDTQQEIEMLEARSPTSPGKNGKKYPIKLTSIR